jgi:endonuclease YncB( thermonuclease family)
MKLWHILLLLLLCISCTGIGDAPKQFTYSGIVVRIADGDTFTILTQDKQQVKVRMHGIDAPEKAQDFGQVSRQRLSDLIFNKQVYIDQKDKDRYGRIVGTVYDVKMMCINEEMLRSGMAWHYTQYDKSAKWQALQEEARKNKTGLWAGPQPVAPWDWRKEKQAKQQQPIPENQ